MSRPVEVQASLNTGVDKKFSPLSIKKPETKLKRVTFAGVEEHVGDEKDDADSYISQRFMSTDEVFAPVESNYKKIQYRKPNFKRGDSILAPGSSSVVDLNYDDTLRRVSVVVQQHVARGERQKKRDIAKLKKLQAITVETASTEKAVNGSLNGRQEQSGVTQVNDSVGNEKTSLNEDGRTSYFSEYDEDAAMAREYALQATADFDEVLYRKPRWKYSFIETASLFVTAYGLVKVDTICDVPNTEKIYQFLKNIFVKCQLSAECSVVCLVYVERLMETAGIDLLANNWRPIMLCGLLLASKVWQDLNCWNVEFASVLPDFPLKSINKLERAFLKYLRYSLFISGSVYAKYYFALRSLGEKKNFRNKYNTVVMTSSRSRMIPSTSHAPRANAVEERSAAVKSEMYAKSL